MVQVDWSLIAPHDRLGCWSRMCCVQKRDFYEQDLAMQPRPGVHLRGVVISRNYERVTNADFYERFLRAVFCTSNIYERDCTARFGRVAAVSS